MNRKILVAVASLFVLSMMLTPFALAKPWEYPKNNDKFETFEVTLGIDITRIIGADWEFVPSEEKPNKLIISWEENMLTYEIKVGDETYQLGSDFLYSGVAVMTVYDPILPPTGILPQGRMRHFRVDYMYDFSAVPGGIEGTIQMLALVTGNEALGTPALPGTMSICSKQGTGDLQNVVIHATNLPPGHNGIVSGWPDIPPAPP